MERKTDVELLSEIREVAERIERTPKAREVPCRVTAIRHWGTWNKALIAAGFEPTKPRSKAVLIRALQEKASELGRTPSQKEMYADNGVPSYTGYLRVFGSWRKACTAAGLSIEHLST